MKSKPILYVAILSLLLIGAFFTYSYFDKAPAETQAQDIQTKIDPKVLQPITQIPRKNAEQAESAPKIIQDQVHPFSKQLRDADDYRALSIKLQTETEKGGAYYASVINHRCFSLMKMLEDAKLSPADTPHNIASKRDQLIDRLKAKCRNFTPDELSVDRLRDLYKQKTKDPVLKAMLAARDKEKSGVEICENLSALFKTQSPEAIAETTLYDSKSGVFFNNKNYGPISYDALGLAMCELGHDCSQDNFFVQKMCVTHSICTNSAVESMKQLLEKSSKKPTEDFAKLSLLSKEMANAIRENDVQKFSPIPCKK